MTTKHIVIAKEFYHRLANRDIRQGDGKHTGVEFRTKFLNFLDNQEAWRNKSCTPIIVLDFQGVKKIAPSFANEVFGHFTKYASPEEILCKIKLVNTSSVQKMIIEKELHSAYSIR